MVMTLATGLAVVGGTARAPPRDVAPLSGRPREGPTRRRLSPSPILGISTGLAVTGTALMTVGSSFAGAAEGGAAEVDAGVDAAAETGEAANPAGVDAAAGIEEAATKSLAFSRFGRSGGIAASASVGATSSTTRSNSMEE